MAHLTYEKNHSIIRMTAEDRQAINRIILHKRQEFEAIIKKGVVAMLNAQEERDRLSAKRSEYINFLTNRSKQKKEQIKQIAQTIQEGSSSAPMGAGTALNIATTATAALGNAIIDNSEDRRQQNEIEQNLYSAQMLYYIPPQDYEQIAEKVASILSYRYQFLIFRLAAGENGYIKLALFFINSMKTFAIARLREQKTNIIKALINAAIPPSTDSISYRDWPSVDFENFRSHIGRLGKRKTLELDEDVIHILRRCGPAVRALLGGIDSYVCYDTGKMVAFSPYTILGALNHAPILSPNKRIISGLLPKHRKYLKLDGHSKYPLILLGHGEKSADLGVNFATKITNEILDATHVEALRRLVPDFFPEQEHFHTNTTNTNITPADFRYPEEKFECPWSAKRELEWKNRLKNIYPLQGKGASILNDEDFDDAIELVTMQNATFQFNLEYKKTDAIEIKKQTLAALIQTYDNLDKKTHALYLGKYAAYAAKEWVRCMLETQILNSSELENVREVIEMANLSIFASRDCPIYETEKYERALSVRKESVEYLEFFVRIQNINQKNHQIIIENLEEMTGFKIGTEFAARETSAIIRLNKYLRSQINDSIHNLMKMRDISRSMSLYSLKESETLKSVEDFYQQLSILQNRMATLPLNTIPEVLDILEFYYQEIILYTSYIKTVISSNNVTIKDFETEEVLQSLEAMISDTSSAYAEYNQIKDENSWWGTAYQQKLTNLLFIKDKLLIYRQQLLNFKSKIQYQSEKSLSNPKINEFFIRTCIQADFYMLLHLSNYNKYYHFNTQEFQVLYQIARQLHIQLQTQYTSEAERVYTTINQKYSKLPRDMELAEVYDIYRNIRSSKDNLELELRDDTEIVDIALNQSKIAFREAEQIIQNIMEFESKLSYIAAHAQPQDRKVNTNGLNLDISNAQILKAIETNALQILNNAQGIVPDSISTDILTEIEDFKLQYEEEQQLDLRYLGIQFLSRISKMISESFRNIHHLKDTLDNFKAHIQKSENALKSRHTELSIERKMTLKLLKQAYLKMGIASQVEQRLMTIDPPALADRWKLTNDTLSWASHLTISEQKWLDQKNALKYKTYFQTSREYKSPQRMAFSLMLAMANEQIKGKKIDLNRLKKIQHKAQMTKLTPISLEATVKTPNAKRAQFVEQKNILLKILQQKILILDDEIEDLEALRTAMLAKRLKLFFNDWKSKTFETYATKKIAQNPQTVQYSEIKDVPKSVDRKDATASFDDTDIDEKQYNIDELERWVVILQQNIFENDSSLTPQSMFSNSPSNGTLNHVDIEEASASSNMAPVSGSST